MKLTNINQKDIKHYLLTLCTGQLIILGLLFGLNFTQAKMSNWIYNTYTSPFLAAGSIITPHNLKSSTITKPLQIEYSVLKVPAVKMTAAKK